MDNDQTEPTWINLIQTYDWSQTPLGPSAGWSKTLRTAVLRNGINGDGLNAEAPQSVRQRVLAHLSVFETTLTAIPDYVYAFNRHNQFVYANAAMLGLFGLSEAEFLGKTFADLDYPKDLDTHLTRHIQKVFATGCTVKDEVYFESPVAPAAWFDYVWGPVFGEDGTVELVVGVSRDTTERHRHEQALKENEERLKLAIEVGELASWDWDIESGKVVWSDLHYQLQGYVIGEIQPSYAAWAARVHPDDLPGAEAALDQARLERTPYRHEFRVRLSDGAIRFMSAQGRFYYRRDGEAVRMIGAMRDVTGRKTAEEALRAREAELARVQAIGLVAGFNVEITRDPILQKRSPEYKRLHGLPDDVESETHLDWLERVHPEDREAANVRLQSIFESDAEIYESKYRIIRPVDDEVRWISARADIERDRFGNPVRLVGAHIDITALKQAETRLSESEDQLQQVLAATSDALLVLDRNGSINFLNDAARSMVERHGLDPREATGQTLFDLFSHMVGPEPDGILRNVLERSEPGEQEFYYPALNIWYAARTFPMPEGGVSVYFQDISARKSLEQVLRNNESYLQRLVDSIADAFVVIDNKWRYKYVNAAAKALVSADGKASASLIGRDLWQVFPNILGTEIETALRAAMYDRAPMSFEHTMGSGNYLCHAYPVPGDGISVLMHDISCQKALENALRSSEAHWRVLTEAMPQLVWIARDHTGSLSYASGQFVRYTGAPEAALLNSGWMHYVHSDDVSEVIDQWARCGKTQSAFEAEYRMRRCDGEFRWFKVRGVRVQTSTSEDCVWYGTCTDVQDTVEARLQAERANEAKTKFLATMSHEMRTPLNAIVGLTSLMLRVSPDAERTRTFLATMRDSAEALSQLIGDLLDFARLDAERMELEMQPVNLKALAEEVLSITGVKAAEKGILTALHYDIGPDVRVCTDPLRLKQILLNLLSNAVKFTDAGRVDLTLTAKVVQGGDLMVCFEVRDTGIGVAPEMVERIFEDFVQADHTISRRFGGSGLGLAISRKLARAMGGDIYATSGVGRGTRFTIDIPMRVAKSGAEAATSSEDWSPVDASGLKILVVEDNGPSALVVTTLLDTLGCQYACAVDGREGVRLFQEEVFDVVLMDIEMPIMDGLKACARMRQIERGEARKATHIIALTAHARTELQDECMALGMDAFLVKPVSITTLRHQLYACAGVT